MRKMVFGLVLVACFASLTNAGDLNLYWDVRSDPALISTPQAPYINSAPATIGGPSYPLYNGGGKGDGQTLYVAPKTSGNEHIWSGLDASVGDLYLYLDANLAAGEVVSSIGINSVGAYDLVNFPDQTYTLESTTFTIDPTAWDGTHVSTAFTNMGSGGIKMVQVPVTGATPVFDAAAGINGVSELNKIGVLHVQGADRGMANYSSGGVIELKMSINELLCTRVKYPGTAATLNVSLGYASGAPQAAVPGNVAGGTSPLPAATIIVKMKGDYMNYGTVDTDGLNKLISALNLAENPTQEIMNPAETWASDFDGSAVPVLYDYSIDTNDLNGFLRNLNVPEEG